MTNHTKLEKRNLKVLFCLFLLSLLIPTSSATIKSIPFIVLFFYCLTQKKFLNDRLYSLLFGGCIVLSFIIFLVHGILEAKDYFFLLYGVLCLKYLSPRYSINSSDLYKYYFYILVPISIFTYFTQGGRLSYIPDANMSINICAGQSTKHGTAIIGYLLFIASLYQFDVNRINSFKISRQNFIFFIFSFYLIFFSTSRSVLLSTIYVFIFYVINYKKLYPIRSFIFLFLIIFSTFFLENLTLYMQYLGDNSFINQIIKSENFETSAGVTSGRAWLWNYHWNVFVNTDFIGGGRSSVDFKVNDFISGINEIARAGSESPITGLLACYGIFGIIPNLLYIYLFYYSIRKNNLIGGCIILGSIYNALTGINLLHSLSSTNIILFLLFFQSFNMHRSKTKLKV